LARTQKNSIIGYEAWKQFYSTGFANQKTRTYEEYIRSPFYNAFSKFGVFCIDIQVLNIPRYVDFLLKEQVKIDFWNKDTTYNKFLASYLKTEDPFDAIARSIETTIKLSESENTLPADYFKVTGPNKICQEVVKGKISPWLLYQSKSGVEFLSGLNSDQERIILPYIAPEYWAIKFISNKELALQIKELMTLAGY
jgi:hypothetical protein